jgi:hypothetical protein
MYHNIHKININVNIFFHTCIKKCFSFSEYAATTVNLEHVNCLLNLEPPTPSSSMALSQDTATE